MPRLFRTRPRRIAAVVGVLALVVAGALQASPSTAPRGAQGEHFPVSAEFRAMLAKVSPKDIARIDRTLVSFHNRNTLSAQNNPHRGIGAARDFIFNEFKQIAKTSGGRMTVEKLSYIQKKLPGQIPHPVRITDVIATLHGTQPASAKRIYVVSGHYDSRCTELNDTKCFAPGADDDASGTTGVIEMARVMATHQFDATIKFMAVAGEEQGLFGSTHFAEVAKRKGLDIAGMLDNDIIGSAHGSNAHSIRLFSEGVPTDETPFEKLIRENVGGENDSPARELARHIKSIAENDATGMKIQLIYRRDRYLRGGDQIPFLENGYRSAVRFTEQRENFTQQHQDVRKKNGVQFGDLPRFVDFNYLARATRVNALTLATLADAPARPHGVQLVATKLTNNSTLVWKPNREPDLRGYEVVWRDTESPFWEHVKFVPAGTTTLTLPISKDNVFFGVRAIDREGNRSEATFPRPLF